MSANRDWIPTAHKLPEQGKVVQTMDSGGHVQNLKLTHRFSFWSYPDESGYVYNTPLFWKPLEGEE
jgi:hypothetical protein